MNMQRHSYSFVRAGSTMRTVANDASRTPVSRIAHRAISLARRRRERVLASLAFLMLIVAWDATLRLDERVAPPRMRLSHAVEHEIEPQAQAWLP